MRWLTDFWSNSLQSLLPYCLLRPQVRRGESDICTLSETDISNAEDIIKTLKPMNDATTLMSEESSPTICLIAPLQAQLIQDTKDSIGESTVVREIKQESKTYKSEQERNTLFTASALDPRFKSLPFLSEEERGEVYGRVIAEAASLEVILLFYSCKMSHWTYDLIIIITK